MILSKLRKSLGLGALLPILIICMSSMPVSAQKITLQLDTLEYPRNEVRSNVPYRLSYRVKADTIMPYTTVFRPIYSFDGVNYKESDSKLLGSDMQSTTIYTDSIIFSTVSKTPIPLYLGLIIGEDTVLKFKRAYTVSKKLDRDLEVKVISPKDGDVINALWPTEIKAVVKNVGKRTFNDSSRIRSSFSVSPASLDKVDDVKLDSGLVIKPGDSAVLTLLWVKFKEPPLSEDVRICSDFLWANGANGQLEQYLENNKSCMYLSLRVFTGLAEHGTHSEPYHLSYDSGKLHIIWKEGQNLLGSSLKASIISISGQRLINRDFDQGPAEDGQASLQIGPLNPGIYILRLQGGQGYQQASKFRVP